ncbi:MAG: kynureninase [Gammaproteobacteria bacterium]|nr:kynureninase [Gammaproteobacteria bacterium]
MDFAETRAQFYIPEHIVYLDGNSLGPLPIAAERRVAALLREEWGAQLIAGWNDAGWMQQPARLGERIGTLIGAPPGTVTVGETLSIRIYQALAAALDRVPDRKVVLSDTGNFPSDLYMAKTYLQRFDQDAELRLVAPQEVEAALDESVAVLMLTQVDYRSGRLHDMAHLTRAAHACGALTLWDLAHSAGALPVALAAAGADFAAGCTYKYLNGGPGAPAFIYVAPAHIDAVQPVLSGWLGHRAPFAFDPDYRPGAGIERMRVGTPPVIAMAALEAALDVFDGVDMNDIRDASMALAEYFIDEVQRRCPQLILASPRDPALRGSQVSFAFDQGYAAMQALIERGVIGDFRAPDIMRFGFAPLYINRQDLTRALDILEEVIRDELWDNPAYKVRRAVT